MTLALRLSQSGFAVTIFEASSQLGGLAAPMKIGGYAWDRFYHVILMSDSNTLGLLDELGLKDKMRWSTTKTGFFSDGKLYSMSNVMEFLRFPPLRLVDKVRLGGSIFYASRIKDWEGLERESAEQWLMRLSGKRNFTKIWLPLLKSKLGDRYCEVSAAFIWAIIARMYAARRAGFKQEMFGYVVGGYATIIRELEVLLEQQGVEVSVNAPVRSVCSDGRGVEIQWDGKSGSFDSAILTVSSRLIAEVCPQLTEKERSRLKSLRYQGVICASYLLKKPLGGYYITNITEEAVPFTAVIEMTALENKATFGGDSLIYLPLYVDESHPLWGMNNESVHRTFFPALQRMYPALSQEDVVAFRVCRAKDVMPLTTVNYSKELLPPMETSVQNIFIVNSAQVANGTMNVNELVGLAKRKAKEVEECIVQSA